MSLLARISLILIVLVAATAVAGAANVPADSRLSVGDFLHSVTDSIRLQGEPGRSLDTLRAAGVQLPATLDPSTPLTEGKVVEVLTAFGIRLNTSRPDSEFSAGSVERLLGVFGTQMALAAGAEDPGSTYGDGPAFDPYSKGKGKGKGGDVTPTDP